MYEPRVREYLREEWAGRMVPKEIWQSKPSFVDPETIGKLANTVNIESLLIAAARTLVDLRNHSASDVATLERSFSAETLLAPVCEIIGMDGLAMTLSSAAIRARLEHGGEGKYIDQARGILARGGGNREYVQKIDKSMNVLTDIFMGRPVVEYGELHKVLWSDGIFDLGWNEGVRFVWRRKSLGSIAKKLKGYAERYGEMREPMDVVGGTVIVPDEADAGEIFAEMAFRAKENPDFNLTPSPSRHEPFVVRGNTEYRAGMIAALERNGILPEEVREEEDERGMNIAKMTYIYDDVPTELQFVHDTVRGAMRTGQISHFGYKFAHEIGGDQTGALEALNQRKRGIRMAMLLKGTERAGQRLRRRVMAEETMGYDRIESDE
jgi:hypothetical protein